MPEQESPEWQEKYNEVIAHFHDETDRSAGILGAEYVNQTLAEVLTQYLVDDDSVGGLFVGYGPLSTFSARIDVAFASGLLNSVLRRELHLIRKIRNHFAHHPLETSFDSSPVKDLCSHLLSTVYPGKEWKMENDNARHRYVHAVGLAVFGLYSSLSQKGRLQEHPQWYFGFGEPVTVESPLPDGSLVWKPGETDR